MSTDSKSCKGTRGKGRLAHCLPEPKPLTLQTKFQTTNPHSHGFELSACTVFAGSKGPAPASRYRLRREFEGHTQACVSRTRRGRLIQRQMEDS